MILDLSKFNQNEYKNRKLGFSKDAENDWCVMCSVSLCLSNLFEVEYYPDVLNEQLKQIRGFVPHTGIVYWYALKEIWKKLGVQTLLYSKAYKKHYITDTIYPPAVISVDGYSRIDDYQPHFLYSISKGTNYSKDDLEVFDPYYCDIINLSQRYLKKRKTKKESIKQSVYSVINFWNRS